MNNVNLGQKEAILTTEGPVLIIAGPGTGKTFTLVKRIVHLIKEKNVKPEEILIGTFTEKAAKELITRVSNELLKLGITINMNEMYIGTFRSICLRIMKESEDKMSCSESPKLLDSFQQVYTVYQNMELFKSIKNFDKDIQFLAKLTKTYINLLVKHNLIDFASIQKRTYDLLINNEDVLKEISSKIKYIMIDEYQDTNYIQEQIVFLLGGDKQNICVVGDGDQGMYRFREAKELADYLEENNIPVYSSRSEIFFERKQILGCILFVFTNYISDLKNNTFINPIHEKLQDYYRNCLKEAKTLIVEDKNLHSLISHKQKAILNEGDTSILNINGVSDFEKYLKANIKDGIYHTREVRNLAKISEIIVEFNYLHNLQKIDNINGYHMDCQFFNTYIKCLYIDVMDYSHKINLEKRIFKSKKLGYICEGLGIENDSTHRALSDAKSTALVYLELLKLDNKEENLDDMLSDMDDWL